MLKENLTASVYALWSCYETDSRSECVFKWAFYIFTPDGWRQDTPAAALWNLLLVLSSLVVYLGDGGDTVFRRPVTMVTD